LITCSTLNIVDTFPNTFSLGSSTYGDFTISVGDLKLFNLEQDMKTRLEEVKNLISTHNNPYNQCEAVLKYFHSSCDPSKNSCSNANQQSFQVTVDQVCAAVNSKTKLKFASMGDEFDNFADTSSQRK
jgi:hypothetical protein